MPFVENAQCSTWWSTVPRKNDVWVFDHGERATTPQRRSRRRCRSFGQSTFGIMTPIPTRHSPAKVPGTTTGVVILLSLVLSEEQRCFDTAIIEGHGHEPFSY
jgi:hypothetical protein